MYLNEGLVIDEAERVPGVRGRDERKQELRMMLSIRTYLSSVNWRVLTVGVEVVLISATNFRTMNSTSESYFWELACDAILVQFRLVGELPRLERGDVICQHINLGHVLLFAE